jgi:hypothetical protein
METENLWEKAASLPIRTGADIVGGFDIGFDRQIPAETQDALMDFVYWVEDHYALPVTLWVDFKYRHYLLDANQKRAGFKFYWVDFATYPVFENFDDLPVIELPVRTEKQTMDEILASFAEAITHYFAWLSGMDMNGFTADSGQVEAILRAYKTRGE